mmetsp:Transcript_8568/g.22093  ORF Transcript_8568/g.22093 Transcript_8568/m.22093 type:complete len:312 (-) Transcript_8568:761-1696(-)
MYRERDPPPEFELTEYEEQRAPHTMVTDATVVSLQMKALDEELICPVCLSLCRGTMTTMDCLHRFCGDCIMKSIRFDNRDVKMCPTCRQAVPSAHRSLRPDPTFDAIIGHVYPDPDVYDQFEEEALLRMKQSSNHRALSDSVREGMKRQAMVRSRTRARGDSTRKGDPSPRPSKKRRSAAATATAATVATLTVHVDLARVNTEPGQIALPELRARHLRVPETCCVAHIVQYTADRLQEEDGSLRGKLPIDLATFFVGGRKLKLSERMVDLQGDSVVVVHYGWTTAAAVKVRMARSRANRSLSTTGAAATQQ